MTPFVYDPAVYDGTNASLTSAVSDDGTPQIGVRYRVPPRCGVAVRLNAGQVLSIENTHGTQVCLSVRRYESIFVDVALPDVVAIGHSESGRQACYQSAAAIVGNC